MGNRNLLPILSLFFLGLIPLEAAPPLKPSKPEQIVTEIMAIADVQINGNRPWDIQVHDASFYDRLLRDYTLALGETYMEGLWDCEAIDELIFHCLRSELDQKVTPTWGMRWEVIKAKLFNRQTKSGSLDVIEQHYQLGNDLFENMLDELMTYSCGYWNKACDLDQAQAAKYDLIARKLGFKKGMRVLDIGCGWGGFAKYVAQHYGVEVVAITLSENQAAFAKECCKGLPVEVRVQDYRDVEGEFDRVVEIGMFEHVGQKNYRTFMEKAHQCLNDGGMLMLHTIGRNTSASTVDPWIEKYIFPGGHLPSIAQIGAAVEELFVMEDWHNFGADYDKTLMAWYQNVTQNWDKVRDAYPPMFYRMWKYYLLSCAGAFRARDIQLWQVVLSKKGVLEGYQTVR